MCYQASFWIRVGADEEAQNVAGFIADRQCPYQVLEEARAKRAAILPFLREADDRLWDLEEGQVEIRIAPFDLQLPLLEVETNGREIFRSEECGVCDYCRRLAELRRPGVYQADLTLQFKDTPITLASFTEEGYAHTVLSDAQRQLDQVVKGLQKEPELKKYVKKSACAVHLHRVDPQLSLFPLPEAPSYRLDWLDAPRMKPFPEVRKKK